ncbi:zinc-ribbon domain-containing protein [Tropicibacter sp. S64]|uniref:zinc-ribbon domain-containing protein n=1 Tax=Tropicibacter sp. S64 TaxID=3415122 RepID=UPI003C7B6452
MSRIRLICPNCGAQYEVPAEVIPDTGRDVQCSNCAHTWFQAHPDHDTALAEEQGAAPEPETWEPEEDEDEGDRALVQPAARDEAGHDDEDEDDWEPEAAPEPRRRELDPQVAEVLREEAERERRRRQAEAETFEMQQDLGLEEPSEDAPARRAREARARMAHIRGEDLKAETPAEAAPEEHPEQSPRRRRSRPTEEGAGRAAAAASAAVAESRRELLPDVEEINQTLRASSEPRSRVTDADEGRVTVSDSKPVRSGGGFARGFFFIVLLFAVLVAVYVSAPQIKSAIPQVAPMVDGYVAWVDGLRIWLDREVTSLMTSLDGMSSEAMPEPDQTTAPASE